MAHDITVFIDSFDGYNDVWPYFFMIFEKYWPDCSFDVKLVTNSMGFNSVDSIKVGSEIDWVSRTYRALDAINTKYVLFLLEDYFLSKPFDNHLLENVLDFISKNNCHYFRLIEIPKSRAANKTAFLPILSNEEYGINLQASIWEVEYLKNLLAKIEKGSAWDFEVYLLRNRDNTKQPLEKCFTIKGNPFGFHNGILKGKWFRREIRFYKKHGISIDFSKRGKLGFFAELRFVFAQSLKRHMPYFVRKILKRIMKFFGFKFVSDV